MVTVFCSDSAAAIKSDKTFFCYVGLVLDRHNIVKEDVLGTIREVIDNPR
jgi:hypothetical protein